MYISEPLLQMMCTAVKYFVSFKNEQKALFKVLFALFKRLPVWPELKEPNLFYTQIMSLHRMPYKFILSFRGYLFVSYFLKKKY